MKKCLVGLSAAVVIAAVISGGVMLTGCDQATNLVGLELTPAFVTMTTGSNVQEFVIATNSRGSLSLPIEWHVSNPALGTIGSVSGYKAVYVRFGGNGQNTVIARDQYDNEGYATINQIAEQYGLSLTASPNPIPSGSNATTITIDDGDAGQAPFTWQVLYPAQGNFLAGQGSDTVVYYGNGPGIQVITVTDAYGVSGTILIDQE